MNRATIAALALALAFPAALLAADGAKPSSCVTCHSNVDNVGDDLAKIPATLAASIHGSVGIGCQDCHGGNPDPKLADDMDAAMDPHFKANPYRGKPDRKDVPAFCARCHSDPVYMKHFQPDARTDQAAEYATSRHGKLLAKGDTKVATCVDCHGTHDIRQPTDVASTVYPTRVAETCAHCHADPEHMKGYKTDDGQPLPVDQYERWKRSVHGRDMIEHGDLYAPTCNDCHGNHGATPPGLESIAFVCGQCHGREAKLFRASEKHAGFERHNEMLADAGPNGCASCHEDPEPQAKMTKVHRFSECVTCHGNHSVIRPTVAMLGPLPETPCALCHEDLGATTANFVETPEKFAHFTQLRDELLAEAKKQNLTGDDLFDFMVDQAQQLPTHTIELANENGQPKRELRPEFERLFTKLRIGKIHYTFKDPVTGKEVRDRIVRCIDCHGDKPALADKPIGYETSKGLLSSMQEIMVTTARADRAILQAKRGGVEMGAAQLDLGHAVDASISLEAQVHGFSIAEDSGFHKQQEKGLEAAKAAWEHGQAGIAELAGRRKGLWVSLVLIGLVLIGLAIKIREISGRS